MSQPDPKTKGAIQAGRGNGFSVRPPGTDGQVLTADSAQADGLNYTTPGSGSVASIWPFLRQTFGTGVDGDLTLVADTTLADSDIFKQYDNLDLAGFKLQTGVLDWGIIIYVKDTLTMGGTGQITTSPIPTDFPVPGVADGVGGPGGVIQNVSGGDGGRGRGYVFVFARTITGTGFIHADGPSGVSGADGIAVSLDQGFSAASVGQDGAQLLFYHGLGWPPGSYTTSGGGQSAGGGDGPTTGGAGTVGMVAAGTVSLVHLTDIQSIAFHAEPAFISALSLYEKSTYGRGWGPGNIGGGGAGSNDPTVDSVSGGSRGEAGGGGGGGGGWKSVV